MAEEISYSSEASSIIQWNPEEVLMVLQKKVAYKLSLMHTNYVISWNEYHAY